MKYVYRLLICMSFLLICNTYGWAQSGIEICDNARDDDGDGLIDINDPDCECPIIEPVSLIPNPSFEDRTCCPSSRSQMDCAKDWIQASAATTDYLHTCGWMGWDNLPPPLPFPDGKGCIGFRNGRFGGNGTNANWKEYAGACLTSPLLTGVSYRFEFYIGFTNSQNAPPLDVIFYGSTNCSNLPFGDNDVEFGCPTNGQGWKELGRVPARGNMNWLLKTITLTPDEDIHAIAIGPDCIKLNRNSSTYYFFDNLVLAEQSVFDFEIQPTAHLCSDELLLEVPDSDSLTYQWYKDGIALLGETSARLSNIYGNGEYRVRVESAGVGCRISTIYDYERPVFYNIIDTTICEGETFFFDNQSLGLEGSYVDTLKTPDNCDSIVGLALDVFYDTGDSLYAKIYPGESFELGGRKYYQPREYDATLTSQTGCDSTVSLFLDFYDVYIPNAFTPNGDGFNDIFTIMGGEELVEIKSLKIFNRWGNVVFEGANFAGNDRNQGWNGDTSRGRAPEGVYIFTAYIVYDDGKERLTSGSVTLIR